MQNLRTALRRPPTLPIRFVLLSQPRTGSSLLNTSLRQHPDIHMEREILNHGQQHDLPQEGDQRLRSALARTDVHAVGCNLHAFQPDRQWKGWSRWESAWQALADDPAIRVIHLQRLDVLAQLASWKMASLLNRWGNQTDIVERPTLRIDPEEYRWFRDWNQAVYHGRLSHLRQHRILPITYEALRDDWDLTIQRVQQFLEVKPLPLKQMATRNETRPLETVIENWSQLPHRS